MNSNTNFKDNPLYNMLKKLCEYDNYLPDINDRRFNKYDFEKTEDFEGFRKKFLFVLIPVAIFLIVNWQYNVLSKIAIFVLFLIIAFCVVINSANFKISIINIVALAGVYIIICFTKIEIFGSRKIFMIMYLVFYILLTLLYLYRNIGKVRKYNKIQRMKNAHYNKTIDELERQFGKLTSTFWWNISPSESVRDKDPEDSCHITKFDQVSMPGKTFTREIHHLVSVKAIALKDADKQEVYNDINCQKMSCVFSFTPEYDRIVMFEMSDSYEDKQKTTTVEHVAPSEEEKMRIRGEVDDKYDFRETMRNDGYGTDSQLSEYVRGNGYDSETVNAWRAKSELSEIRRSNEAESKIAKKTYNKYNESKKSFDGEHKYQIGYIIDGKVYFNDSKLHFLLNVDRSGFGSSGEGVEKLWCKIASLYIDNCPEFVEKLKLNPVAYQHSYFATRMAAIAAHSDGFWESF